MSNIKESATTRLALAQGTHQVVSSTLHNELLEAKCSSEENLLHSFFDCKAKASCTTR
jgi:hypothetical protein